MRMVKSTEIKKYIITHEPLLRKAGTCGEAAYSWRKIYCLTKPWRGVGPTLGCYEQRLKAARNPPVSPLTSSGPALFSRVSDRRRGVSAGDAGGGRRLRQASSNQAEQNRKMHKSSFSIKAPQLRFLFAPVFQSEPFYRRGVQGSDR